MFPAPSAIPALPDPSPKHEIHSASTAWVFAISVEIGVFRQIKHRQNQLRLKEHRRSSDSYRFHHQKRRQDTRMSQAVLTECLT
jgi:hypothetical protein